MEQIVLPFGPDRRVLSVSELNGSIRVLLDQEFSDIWVSGEISGVKLATSGHYYFTLKDAAAQLRCVCFRSTARFLKFKPQDGAAVLARGRIDVYEARGEYQLQVEALELQGHGALQFAFEQLKKKLAAEGLFEQARKRPLPRFPARIGIVTSQRGAVISDMLHILSRRFPGLHIRILPAQVQGAGSIEEVCRGIQYFSRGGWAEVVIVARGGGSLEDLWTFNEEAVARAIAASAAPVISAIGHETDFTIADFVADLRAPTPSAAAELVVRTREAVVDALDDLRERLERAATRPLRDLERRVDELALRLRRAMTGELRHRSHRVEMLVSTLRSTSPVARVATRRHRLERLDARLAAAVARSCDQSRGRLRALVAKLDSLSPLAVLGRGYSLTRTAAGAIVRSARAGRAGEDVRVLPPE